MENTKADIKEKILKEYPRLKIDDKFKFGCHPGVSCFNKCCNDVNIFLTPYDIVRLKNALGITSGEFLEKYTLLPLDENLKHPVVMLRMRDDNKNCNFVGEKGCSVYENRPWACRMYPLGVASPSEISENNNEEFYFLLKEEVCHGFEESAEWSVQSWMDGQDVAKYAEFGELFKSLSLHEKLQKGKPMEPVKLEMFYMACYDIDKFRQFVFKSSFLKRFDISDDVLSLIKEDDYELLKFAFDWLRFSLFGETTMKVKEEYLPGF